MTRDALRTDKFLWHIRLFKSRSIAQAVIDLGHARLNGKRIERSSTLVHVGDVLTVPRGEEILSFRILEIPPRRGSAQMAAACYQVI
jgi:ribosome-associated heat shock protein Hsp15